MPARAILRDLRAARHRLHLHLAQARRGFRASPTASPCCATASARGHAGHERHERRRSHPAHGRPPRSRTCFRAARRAPGKTLLAVARARRRADAGNRRRSSRHRLRGARRGGARHRRPDGRRAHGTADAPVRRSGAARSSGSVELDGRPLESHGPPPGACARAGARQRRPQALRARASTQGVDFNCRLSILATLRARAASSIATREVAADASALVD